MLTVVTYRDLNLNPQLQAQYFYHRVILLLLGSHFLMLSSSYSNHDVRLIKASSLTRFARGNFINESSINESSINDQVSQ